MSRGASIVRHLTEGLPRTYWLLVAGMFCNRLGSFVMPFFSLYLREEEGMSMGQIGLTLAALGAGSVIAAHFGGELADRWGRRPTIQLSMVGGAAMLAVLSVAHTPALLAAAAFGLGAFADLYRPAVSAAIGDVVAPAHRARAFAHLLWAYNIAFALSPLVAGLLVARVGYTWLFAGDATTMLLAAGMLGAFVPETRPRDATTDATGKGAKSVAVPWRRVVGDPRLWPILLGVFAIGYVIIQVPASLALVMAEDGIDAARYGQLIALNGLLIAVIQPWSVPWFERLGRRHVMPAAALLFGLGFSLHGAADSVATHAAAIAVWTLGEIVLFPMCNATVADIAPPALRGRYQGAYGTAWSIPTLVGPPLGLALLGGWGPAGWGAGELLGGAAAAAAFVLAGTRIARSAVASTRSEAAATA